MTRIAESNTPSPVMAFLALRKGQELKAEDLQQVLEMCVPESTCEAREEKRDIMIEDMKGTLTAINVTLSAMGTLVGEVVTDVAVIKDAHRREAMTFSRRVALAAVVVAAFGIVVQQTWAIMKPLIFK